MHDPRTVAGRYPAGTRLGAHTWWVQGTAVMVLVGLLYRDIFAKLAGNWWTDPNFSHGFFVPLFSAFLLWRDRRRLASIPVKPSWFGLVLVAVALGTLILGVMGAELFLSRSSFLFLLAGLIVTFLGWNYFRAVLFPWAFLFLMIPIPAIIFNQITFPLQLLASRVATSMLQSVGVHVLREGNVIQLPVTSLDVAEACSGIRSLLSLTTLAIVYGYLLDRRVLGRVALFVAAVPIAIVANASRIVGTGLVAQYWDPEKAQGFYHEFSGWIIFVVSLGMLFLTHGALSLFYRRRGAVSMARD